MKDPYSASQKKLSKESIVTALFRLLERHPFNEITITQIAIVAGVSRIWPFIETLPQKEISFYLSSMIS